MPRPSLDEVLNDPDDEGLLDVAPARPASSTSGRIAGGFEEINAFVDRNGRAPDQKPGRTAGEKALARRLEVICKSARMREDLASQDRHGLLAGPAEGAGEAGEDAEQTAKQTAQDAAPTAQTDQEGSGDPGESASAGDEPVGGESAGDQSGEDFSLDDVLDDPDLMPAEDIRTLRHVRPASERSRPDYVARKKTCPDFDRFKPLFDEVAADIDAGRRKLRRFRKGSEVHEGQFFVLRGVTAYVAECADDYSDNNRSRNARLRVIYANGTESDNLRRSFAAELYKDHQGRRVTEPVEVAPSQAGEETNPSTGIVYVLRSLSQDPEVARNRHILHKIGVTSGEVERRIQDAENQTTFLRAPVEIVATYRLYNVDRARLEHLLHTFFSPARANISVTDNFGRQIRPREWFFVLPETVHEAVERVQDGSLRRCYYDASAGCIVDPGANGGT